MEKSNSPTTEVRNGNQNVPGAEARSDPQHGRRQSSDARPFDASRGPGEENIRRETVRWLQKKSPAALYWLCAAIAYDAERRWPGEVTAQLCELVTRSVEERLARSEAQDGAVEGDAEAQEALDFDV